MRQFGVDLHMHTTASDGTDSPRELLDKVIKAGISCFSVTDHDTDEAACVMTGLVDSWNQSVGEDRKLRYVHGIEFSCESTVGKCHILGYGCDREAASFTEAVAMGRTLRQQKLTERLRFLEQQFGLWFSEEEKNRLFSMKSPGKPHIAKLLVEHGEASSITEAIQKYVNHCPGENDRIHATTALQAIRLSGGLPVWAHPLGGEGEKRVSRETFVKQLNHLSENGLGGLECFYSRYSLQEEHFLENTARERELLVTCGSDYHGTAKPGISPGMICNEDDLPKIERITGLKRMFPANM